MNRNPANRALGPDRLPTEKQSWYGCSLSLPASENELVSVICWESDALGADETLEGTQIQATIYFSAEHDPLQLEAQLRAICRLAGVDSGPIRVTRVTAPDDLWLSSVKEHFRGVSVGKFFVHPPWIEGQSGRVNLLIDPGHAFGTGTHESTQLILQELPVILPGMKKVLDVGTGSGILAIGAHRLFPAMQILGIDIDPDAIDAARRNALANQARILLIVGETDSVPSEFDLVLANLTRPLIRDLAPELVRLAGRRLVTSGFTIDEELLVKESILANVGWHLVGRGEKRGWVCLQFERQ